MSNKKEKKNATKETPNNGKTLMLKLDNRAKVPARIVHEKENNECFKINDIDFFFLKKRLYCKKYNSYKYYVL